MDTVLSIITIIIQLFSNQQQVHYTILKLIDRLDKKGYQLILATDVARYFELSTLFFTEKPPRGKTICIYNTKAHEFFRTGNFTTINS